MKGEYDIIEDVKVKKDNVFFNYKYMRIVLGILIFLILCGLCFNLVYLLSFNNIERNNISINKKDNTNGIFMIEQKLRKDLEKMKANIKTK